MAPSSPSTSSIGWNTWTCAATVGPSGGAAQGLVLVCAASARWGRAAWWAAAAPALWALGWTVTTVVGVDVERHHTVFGSSGALASAVPAAAILAWVLDGRAGLVR